MPLGGEFSTKRASPMRENVPRQRSTVSFIHFSAPRISPIGRNKLRQILFSSVKDSRYITHILRLKGIGEAAVSSFASRVLRLDAKLGPILR